MQRDVIARCEEVVGSIDPPVRRQRGDEAGEIIREDGVKSFAVVGSGGEGNLNMDRLVAAGLARSLKRDAGAGVLLLELQTNAPPLNDQTITAKLNMGDIDSAEGEGRCLRRAEEPARSIEAEHIGAPAAAKVEWFANETRFKCGLIGLGRESHWKQEEGGEDELYRCTHVLFVGRRWNDKRMSRLEE